MSNTFYKNNQQPKDEMFSTFYKNDINTRSTEFDGIKELIKTRDNLKTKFKEKINAGNSVKDILKNYLLNGYDYKICYKFIKILLEY